MLILKGLKVLCFHTLLQVLILKGLSSQSAGTNFSVLRRADLPEIALANLTEAVHDVQFRKIAVITEDERFFIWRHLDREDFQNASGAPWV